MVVLLASEDDWNAMTEPSPGKALVGEGGSVPGSGRSRTVPISLSAYLEEIEERGSSIIA